MNTIEQAKRALEALFVLHAKPQKVTELIVRGGEGSGNFGHAGRPGEVGGSAPDGGGGSGEAKAPAGGEGEGGGANYREMSLSELAREVRKDWGSKVNFAAKPYLEALGDLESINDNYGLDSGKSIVAYFLSNAATWKGPTAKAVKAELNRRIKGQ